MSLESVRAFFAQHHLDLPILETEALTPTVESAALAHGVEPGRIAKTLAFRLGDGRVVLLVAAGHARIDNAKFKQVFGKGKMLPADEVLALTGHPVGGVCPFGLAQDLPVFLDQTLQAFDEVLPAAGSVNSAVRISPALMAKVTGGVWVDACR
jgi:prolyl-tRNA editing enzyme YbaK/EbsC (Cys-tRNA(Pro) deacylase)